MLYKRMMQKDIRTNVRKYMRCGKILCGFMLCAFMLGGCGAEATEEEKTGEAYQKEDSRESPTEQVMEEAPGDTAVPSDTEESPKNTALFSDAEEMKQDTEAAPELIETDWSEYFDGLQGAAVVYDASASRYVIYNPELADTRKSPCSTFKIVSSAIALENGILEPEESTRSWSGEIFWNENWNKDIAFEEAFRVSCIWYFREMIDEMGPEMVQEGLDRLEYGNCDISDWEGRLNTNNNNRALTGFWVESSLLISPKEQTEVMERIFGPDSICKKETRNELKKVMLVPESEKNDIRIYGKTGMGKAEGVLVDAWFTGFAESAGRNVYFCVYLGRTEDGDVSSATAREIAIRIVEDYCNESSF